MDWTVNGHPADGSRVECIADDGSTYEGEVGKRCVTSNDGHRVSFEQIKKWRYVRLLKKATKDRPSES